MDHFWVTDLFYIVYCVRKNDSITVQTSVGHGSKCVHFILKFEVTYALRHDYDGVRNIQYLPYTCP